MKINRINPESSIDYPGKFGPVFFTSGCNFNCGFCYNLKDESLMNREEVERFMKNLEAKARQKWYTGVTICGGEPTLQPGLIGFIRRLKDMGLAVKLDTNGSSAGILQELHKEKLVDYVAMDIKGPRHLYRQIIGLEHFDERDDLYKGMCVVQRFPGHEYRTTDTPIIENGKIRWLTSDEMEDMAKYIADYTQDNSHTHFLQKYIPVQGRINDSRLEEIGETSDEILEQHIQAIRKWLPNAKIR
jgi:pyruvate formate lyase activating enzyme